MKPIVVILGRPNVGKSTLFNRLTRSKSALVDDLPGVTRDRHYGNVNWAGGEFALIDTGGFLGGDDDFGEQIRRQVAQAIADADAIIFLLDAQSGISPFDREIADMLRPVDKPVFIAVNKIDGQEQEHLLSEFFSLGVDRIYPISAEHRYGINDLLDDLLEALPISGSVTETPSEATPIRLAVVGRPNVGKSSLINRLLGQERLLVSDTPGTTRDAIDTLCRFNQRDYLLIDTAGIRRKGRVSDKLEKFSIIKALKSLNRCDIAGIVVDAHEGITDQDVTVAGYAHQRGCGCVFLLNKWDLVPKTPNVYKTHEVQLRSAAKFLSFAPMITVSALTGQRLTKLFAVADRIYDQYNTRIGTGRLNRLFEAAMVKNPPSIHRGRRIKFYYAAQVAVKPPTMVCFVNYPDAVHFSYKRFLVNQIRNETGLTQTPIRLIFRKRESR